MAPMPTPGDVVVILQNRPFFGALLVHLPLLHGLRQQFPDAKLICYSNFDKANLLAALGAVDEVVVYRKASWELWRSLRRRQIACLVSLRPRSTGLNMLVGWSGAARRIGYRHGWTGWCYTDRIPRDTGIYRAVAYNKLLTLLDPTCDPHACQAPIAALAEQGDWQRPTCTKLITILPCGSEDRKNWGLSNYLQLLSALAKDHPDARFCCVLGDREQGFIETLTAHPLADRLELPPVPGPCDIARIVQASELCIANDCGPGHVAMMASGALLSLFGNWDGQAQVRIDEWCHRRAGVRCLTTKAPGDLDKLPVEAVLTAARELLADPTRASDVQHV